MPVVRACVIVCFLECASVSHTATALGIVEWSKVIEAEMWRVHHVALIAAMPQASKLTSRVAPLVGPADSSRLGIEVAPRLLGRLHSALHDWCACLYRQSQVCTPSTGSTTLNDWDGAGCDLQVRTLQGPVSRGAGRGAYSTAHEAAIGVQTRD